MLLESFSWPAEISSVTLSPDAKNQLKTLFFDEVDVAASVSAVAAVALIRQNDPIGALMMLRVSDPVVGNMSFLDGFRSAIGDSQISRWGPMSGSVTQLEGRVWGVLPLHTMVVVTVTSNRSNLDEVMTAVVERFTRR